MAGGLQGGNQNDDLETGVIVDAGKVVELPVGAGHKKQEQRERTKRTDELGAQLKAYQRRLLDMDEEAVDARLVIKMRMLEINNEIDDLAEEEMTEEKFWGLAGLGDEDDDFDYGRDVLREQNYDWHLRNVEPIAVPYAEIPLFLPPDWFAKTDQVFTQVGGILRAGLVSGAVIKARAVMQRGEDEDEDDDDGEDMEGDKVEPIDNENRNEKIQKLMAKIAYECPFEIHRPEHMQSLIDDANESFKVRLYLINCQNLSAMGSVIDLKSRLAGMTAMCTANPYPVVKVGDGINTGGFS